MEEELSPPRTYHRDDRLSHLGPADHGWPGLCGASCHIFQK